jgi:hypothetical protein
MDLVRTARGDSKATPPPDYRLRPRPKRPTTAGRLMRGGMAQVRSRRRDDEVVDDGAPIQQSLF